MTHSYKVPRFGDHIVDEVPSSALSGRDLAKTAADDFHSNHDGWECSWPLEFVILREDGSEVGTYSVEREAEPVFYAYEVKVLSHFTEEQREAAIEKIWPYSGTAKMRPDGKASFFTYLRTAGNVWGRSVELQCELTEAVELLRGPISPKWESRRSE